MSLQDAIPQQQGATTRLRVQAPVATRLAGLDAARGIMMLLGIVIHSANVYMTRPWRVHDAAPSLVFDYVNAGIHAFRMEAFFWVAGFFAAMLIDRQSLPAYLKHRIQQLLVPLVATLCTLNVLEYLIISTFPSPGVSGGAPHHWIGHLWFLVDLVLFSLVLVPCMRKDGLLQRCLNKFVCRTRSALELLAVLALISAASIAASAVSMRVLGLNLNMEFFGLTSLGRLLTYAPYFALGMVIHRSLELRRLFGAVHPVWLVPGIALQAWLAVNATESTSWTLLQMTFAALTWLNVAAVIALMDRCFTRPTRTTAWLADAAYPIYLTHHLFVVALGTLLLTSTMSVFIKFALVLGLATLASVGAHQLSKRVPWMRWLFTGRYLDSGKTSAQTLPPKQASPRPSV
jgi:glucan biosynthesis protein C